jgi:hypothetical protein
MQTITDFIWRIRCAFWFLRRLGLGWTHHAWYLSGVTLAAEQETRALYNEPMQSPCDAVDEELSCWSD